MVDKERQDLIVELVEDALDIVDDDLPEGARMAMLTELTGLEADTVAEALAVINSQRKKG